MSKLRILVAAAALLVAPVPVAFASAALGPGPAQPVPPELPRATCSAGDSPEPPTQLQGQVTVAERAAGFGGFRCNLRRVGGYPGPGASYVGAASGNCAYYSTAGKGVEVIDLTDPAHARKTATLTSPAMMHSWESLKVNPTRHLMAATSYGADAFDVYSIADCQHPQLLASLHIPSTQGHEGAWAPDGQTYYITNRQNTQLSNFGFLPVDLVDPGHPRVLPRWDTPGLGKAHGLSLSADGNRMYLAVPDGIADPSHSPGSGFLVLDVSQVQSRAPHPQVRLLSNTRWLDGGEAQMTIPITVHGRPELIATDEWGSYSFDGGRLGCGFAHNGGSAYGYPRVFDITDERAPEQLRTLRLQAQNPANCDFVVNDTAHLFSYSTHYCAVDRPVDPRLLGCGTFEAGLRIFDIHDLQHVREVAYFNPPNCSGTSSEKAGLGYRDVDWASSPPVFRLDRNQIWVQFQDNGVEVLSLEKKVMSG